MRNQLWVWHPIVTSNRCDNLEEEDMSGIKHGRSMSPCVSYLFTNYGIKRYQKEKNSVLKRWTEFTTSIKSWLTSLLRLQKWKNRCEFHVVRILGIDVFDKFLLNLVGNILSRVELTRNTWPNVRCSVFLVELLHSFRLGISKKLKECTVSYGLCSELDTIPLLPKMHQKRFSFCRNRLLNGWNILLRAYENDFK